MSAARPQGRHLRARVPDEDRTNAESRRRAVRGRDDLPADLRGRPRATLGSQSDVDGLFGRPLGRRHVRRHYFRLQRPDDARSGRASAYGSPARDRALPPARRRPHRSQCDAGRSQGVYEAVDAPDRARSRRGRRAHRIRLRKRARRAAHGRQKRRVPSPARRAGQVRLGCTTAPDSRGEPSSLWKATS